MAATAAAMTTAATATATAAMAATTAGALWTVMFGLSYKLGAWILDASFVICTVNNLAVACFTGT